MLKRKKYQNVRTRSVLKTQASHQTSLDQSRRMQTSAGESLDESRQMQTSVDESLDKSGRLQMSVDECRLVQTNETSVNELIFFDINGGFPRQIFLNLCRFLPQRHRRLKKFVLHCTRCTVVTRFFNPDFVRI